MTLVGTPIVIWFNITFVIRLAKSGLATLPLSLRLPDKTAHHSSASPLCRTLLAVSRLLTRIR